MASHRTLFKARTAFRIGDPDGEYRIWSAEGARRAAGRWHETGASVIYAAEHFSTALLEKLVHYSGDPPPDQHYVQIDLPVGLSYEVVNTDRLPNWADAGAAEARGFGRDWYAEQRSVLLIVPSVIARMDMNFVINTKHPDFAKIEPGLETPIWWDDRLFGVSDDATPT